MQLLFLKEGLFFIGQAGKDENSALELCGNVIICKMKTKTQLENRGKCHHQAYEDQNTARDPGKVFIIKHMKTKTPLEILEKCHHQHMKTKTPLESLWKCPHEGSN